MARRGRKRKKTTLLQKPVEIDVDYQKAQHRFEIIVLVILLAFGVYKSIRLFGALPVPNPDYSGFVRTGQELLAFNIPSTFKRAPVLGILIVTLSNFVGGAHPMLTAGWLLNAIMGVLNTVLLWQIAKKLLGNAGIWFAVVAVLNPWVMRYQTSPIAETSMIFFTLATFYFIFRHSKWAYLFASIASMVRYECTVLIFIAFLMDMVTGKTKKQRCKAFLYAALASLPFLLWMFGTYYYKDTKTVHYIGHYKVNASGTRTRTGFPKYFLLLWNTIYAPLFQLPAAIKATFTPPATQQQAVAIGTAITSLHLYSKIIAGASAALAIIYSIIKRNWYLLSLAVFMFFYIMAHSMRISSHTRYCVPAVWLALLISWYGFYVLWKLFDKDSGKLRIITLISLTTIMIPGLIYFFKIAPSIPKTARAGIAAYPVVYAAMITIGLILLAGCWLFKFKFFARYFVLSILTCAMIGSQHFMVAKAIGRGSYNYEFKMLADWYAENAKPGEKMGCTWSPLLKILLDGHADNIIELKTMASPTFEGFVENCYENNLTYVACTARGSAKVKKGLLPALRRLSAEKDYPPFRFIERFRVGTGRSRWVSVFELMPRQEQQDQDELKK
ncbi:MAG: hypothetical protein KAJ07_02270 [Planctomycetes bacterium]|nr:hypothetical protein [Planctomycetota bacterium]